MTLDQLGNVGELIGAIAVVVSLVYLAIQVRQNTAAVHSSTHQGMLGEVHQVLASLTEGHQVAELFVKANEDFDALSEPDRVRFHALIGRFLNIYETAYYSYRRSNLEPELWRAWETGLVFWVSGPAVQRYWERWKAGYLPEFRQHFESNFYKSES